MTQFLAEWALRSSILIACAALLLAVLRVKDSSVRLAGWTAILAGSLLIPVMIMFLPPVPIRILHSQPPTAAHALNTVTQQASGSFIAFPEIQRPTPPKAPLLDWMTVLSFAYGLAAALMLLRLLTGLVISLRLLRKTHPTGRAEFRESSCVNSPVTIGLIRPVIVLPLDWPQWESTKLRAVLAHERAHIRRRDPLVQFVSAIHRAALWFSPLSWLLHSRIVAIAEEASDDAAVVEMSESAVYAELLLDFMRRPALRSKPVGIPMARYGRPDRRIQRILNATSFSRGLTGWSIAGLLVVAAPLTYLTAVSQASAQAAPHQAERPKFDAASIKPCDPNVPPPGGRGRATAGANHFRRDCMTVRTLIQNAYIRFADGTGHNTPIVTGLTKIEGGPGWINSDQYTIEAESLRPAMMDGPMMQTLLEDRFQLRVHRETRDSPIYELTVAKGGSKILPFKQGPCAASDFAGSPMPYSEPSPEAANQQCWFFLAFTRQPNKVITARNDTVADLAASLTAAVDRLVIDKTGITGNVDFRLVYSDGGDPGNEEFEQPPILTAIQQQLGLKLEPSRGPRDYLVIDSISRPSSN